MPKATGSVVMLLLALVVLGQCVGCASAPSGRGRPSETPSAQETAVDLAAMRQVVTVDVGQIDSELGAVFAQNPRLALDSSWAAWCATPSFERLVARGKPVLEAIALEIESGRHSAHIEQLLALAGAEILGHPEWSRFWVSGKAWVVRYRSAQQPADSK